MPLGAILTISGKRGDILCTARSVQEHAYESSAVLEDNSKLGITISDCS